ncbi:MAG: zinc finger domain-containing protein [Alphaproteobacteria bacterium]
MFHCANVIEATTQSGRATYYCPHCQRARATRAKTLGFFIVCEVNIFNIARADRKRLTHQNRISSFATSTNEACNDMQQQMGQPWHNISRQRNVSDRPIAGRM